MTSGSARSFSHKPTHNSAPAHLMFTESDVFFIEFELPKWV